MVKVEINEVSVYDAALVPGVLFRVTLEYDQDELIIPLSGILYAADNKFLSQLFPLSPSDGQEKRLIAYGTSQGKGKCIIQLNLLALLNRLTLEHVENLRKRDRYGRVLFRLHITYMRVLPYIDIAKLYFDTVNIQHAGYSYLEYWVKPPRDAHKNPLPVLLSYSQPYIAIYSIGLASAEKFIEERKWLEDFWPKLTGKKVVLLEVPLDVQKPYVDIISKAIEELEHAWYYFREGRYDSVVRVLRNILYNYLTEKRDDTRRLISTIADAILAKVPADVKGDYEYLIKESLERQIRGLLKHLSKFVHLEENKLLKTPLREDAEHLLLATTSLLKYISSLLSKD